MGHSRQRRQNPNQRVPDHGTRRKKVSVARREILGYPRAKPRRVVPAPSLVPSEPGGFSPPWAVVFSVERIFSAPLHRALGRQVNAVDRVAMLSTVPGDARRTVWSRVARGQRCPTCFLSGDSARKYQSISSTTGILIRFGAATGVTGHLRLDPRPKLG